MPNTSGSNKGGGSNRGFAAMDSTKQREIASKGGKARANDPDIKSGETGRKGGEAVSRDRQHMADIGRKGGKK